MLRSAATLNHTDVSTSREMKQPRIRQLPPDADRVRPVVHALANPRITTPITH